MVANADYESKLITQGYKNICGIDEVGCGSLSGDVYMACVIFPPEVYWKYKTLIPGLNDSKQKTEEQREKLYPIIKNCAVCWSVASASVEEIDKLNIYWAKWLAARRAIEKLDIKPDYILMDGDKKIPEIDIPQTPIVKGDGKSISIAAASIIAKVDRDRYIVELDKEVHPDYGFAENKGYYTKKHIAALENHGKTIYHRQKYVEKFLKQGV